MSDKTHNLKTIKDLKAAVLIIRRFDKLSASQKKEMCKQLPPKLAEVLFNNIS